MLRGVFGEEAFTRRGDEGVSDIGEDGGRAAFVRVEDQAHAELVGGAFEAECDHCAILQQFF